MTSLYKIRSTAKEKMLSKPLKMTHCFQALGANSLCAQDFVSYWYIVSCESRMAGPYVSLNQLVYSGRAVDSMAR
jgi:hypothetical protein